MQSVLVILDSKKYRRIFHISYIPADGTYTYLPKNKNTSGNDDKYMYLIGKIRSFASLVMRIIIMQYFEVSKFREGTIH